MRNLPLNDPIWYSNNATAQVKTKHYQYNHRCTIDVHFPNLRQLCINGITLINNYDIFIDVVTGEVFKRHRSWDKSSTRINQLINSNSVSLEDRKTILDAASVKINIHIADKALNYENAMNKILFKFYENNGINIKKLSDSSLSEFRAYSRDILIDIPKLKIREVCLETFVSRYTKNNDAVYFDSIIDKLNKTVDNVEQEYSEKIHLQLEKKIDSLWIKYLLLEKDSKFSGSFSVSFFRYSGNENKNTFDVMEIKINMMNNYKENLDFIKANPEKVRTLLKEITDRHSKSKKYANYLKLYDLVLTRGNVLVAKFCFKLEEKC